MGLVRWRGVGWTSRLGRLALAGLGRVGRSDRHLADLIVSMCKTQKLDIVAEGVETPEQHDWVRSRGIERFQGYLFAKPMTAEAFAQVLGSSKTSPEQ